MEIALTDEAILTFHVSWEQNLSCMSICCSVADSALFHLGIISVLDIILFTRTFVMSEYIYIERDKESCRQTCVYLRSL